MERHIVDLPHIDGYQFIGITIEGERKCHVVRDPEFGTYYVDGEAKYCDLIAWRKYDENGLMET